MNIKGRIHNIVTTLDKTSFWQGFVDLYESIIGLLQRMMDTGDKSYAELEDIKGLLMTIVEQNEALLMEMKRRRWKR